MAIELDLVALQSHPMPHSIDRLMTADKLYLIRMNSILDRTTLTSCVWILNCNYHSLICSVDLMLVASADGWPAAFAAAAADWQHFQLVSVQWFAFSHHPDYWSICYYFDSICLPISGFWYHWIVPLLISVELTVFDYVRSIVWWCLWSRPLASVYWCSSRSVCRWSSFGRALTTSSLLSLNSFALLRLAAEFATH